jgi:putative transposase
MPRANRHYLPGHIWHITHRCHQRKFLLKFAVDRRRYLHWVFEAKKRFGLSVLDYVVTSNHVHLLVKDTGRNVIAHSMQLIAGRTAQEYNQRRATKGAFWEDRYHATAIEIDAHLHRCVVHIDLNMVRAGAVNHPGQWNENGFCEIQRPPKRYAIIDLRALSELCGFEDIDGFQTAHRQWIEEALARELSLRDVRWSEAIAVGSLAFIEKIKGELGSKAMHRGVEQFDGTHVLREASEVYGFKSAGENEPLSPENTVFWDESFEDAKT